MLLGAISIGAAQETAEIMVGGQVVARVREKASFESVQHRAAAVEDKINQVLATTDDPASLDVSLRQVDGLWTVIIGETPIVSVYPAEAAANEMAPEVLGSLWVRQFRDALPGAATSAVTPIGPPPATGTGPVAVADEPVLDSPTTVEQPAVPATPTTPSTPSTPTTPTTPTTPPPATVEVLEVPSVTQTPPDEIVAGQGARLLILESLNEARGLPEDDYLVRREAMADTLFNDLVQVMTGGRSTGRIESGGATATTPTPPRPPAGTATTTTAPPPTTGTIDTGPLTIPPTTTVVTPPAGAATSVAPLEISEAGRAKIMAKIPSNDASYANVLQKVVIKAKFKAATDAFRAASSSDPAVAAQARETLSAARKANTSQDFDAAERYLDTGLRILGVTQWEQHIDAAMSELGL
jgi:hypothetical protein